MTSIGRTTSLRGDSPPTSTAPPTPLLIICRGIPASGKTTWAKQWLAEKPSERSRVNRDDLRQSLFGLDAGNLTHDEEKTVTMVHHATIRALLAAGRAVVCDDTNPRAKTVRELRDIAKESNAAIQIQDFDTPPALCIERDRQRAAGGGRQVGEAVIRSFADRYLRKGVLPPISDDTETSTATTYVPDTSKPVAWIVDVDGTLAKMNGRGPFEWHRVHEDAPNSPVVKVVNALWDIAEDIIIVSGRAGSCYDATKQWLHDHGVRFDHLFMREAGDTRKDAVVKSEIFWRDIAPNWNVQGVFDDRDQVVEMWRSLGLTCFQVAKGNF